MSDTQNKTGIEAFRAEKGLSLKEFGELFGVHKTTVMRWEEGQIPAERAVEIEQKTGISRRDLRPDLYLTADNG